MRLSRRRLIHSSLIGLGLAGASSHALASNLPTSIHQTSIPSSKILAIAKKALAQNAQRVKNTDVLAITDFSTASHTKRFYLVDTQNGVITPYLVAHGRGSDPEHTGWVKTFSNEFGSYASSPGAYLTGDLYEGKHGKSMRLIGLDPDNNNAQARAIVIHSAWYVSDEMVKTHAKLGRSEGCFALCQTKLDEVLTRLGPNRLLVAGKF